MRGHKNVDVDDRIIESLLSPSIIEECGIEFLLPKADRHYNYEIDWNHTYCIMGVHSYMKSFLKPMGHLAISRSISGNEILYDVTEVIVNADGLFNTIKADFSCRENLLESLVSWRYESTLTDTSLCVRPELTITSNGRIADGIVYEICNGKESTYRVGEVTPSWAMIDVVQRIKSPVCNFNVLERLRITREKQMIGFLEEDKLQIASIPGLLKGIYHIGTGTIPTELWLDEKGRVVMLFSGTAAYILDEKATERTEDLIEKLIQGGTYYEY